MSLGGGKLPWEMLGVLWDLGRCRVSRGDAGSPKEMAEVPRRCRVSHPGAEQPRGGRWRRSPWDGAGMLAGWSWDAGRREPGWSWMLAGWSQDAGGREPGWIRDAVGMELGCRLAAQPHALGTSLPPSIAVPPAHPGPLRFRRSSEVIPACSDLQHSGAGPHARCQRGSWLMPGTAWSHPGGEAVPCPPACSEPLGDGGLGAQAGLRGVFGAQQRAWEG